ncbi:MAG: MFS transporter [Clostridia bacterium]|nr:MFS transporter [Clostridia bacterium]
MNEQTLIQNKKYNVKLFPFYKAISWDLLFYYAISFLFLTNTKGISAADVLFVDAFYPIFKFILQIPNTAIVNKLGNRLSLILGNIFVAASILLWILADGMTILILSQFLSALGFSLKSLTETNLLYDSIEKSDKRNDIFSKIDGKSSSYYYYIDAITSLITGFLFVINGYLPMLLCFGFCILSTLLSFSFKEVEKTKSEKISILDNINDIKERI